MPEIGPEHPLTYRQETVAPFFKLIRDRESCAIVGPSSMGKSRLIHFIFRPDVQQRYLGEHAPPTLFVLADCNRLAEVSEWGLYELLLTALTEALGPQIQARSLRGELNTLRREVVTNRNALLSRRHVELAVHMLCQEHKLELCFILDEFDESYRTLPPLALANLRALRDANKYRLCYALVVREHPIRLRPPAECEGFYELFSRSVLGLGPCATEDAERVVQQLEARKDQTLPEPARSQLLKLSGGHPGLIVALFDAMSGEKIPDNLDWQKWALTQPVVIEECRKIWDGLAEDERLALSHLTQHIDIAPDIRQVLEMKGLLYWQDGAENLFSPIFVRFVLSQNPQASEKLRIDKAAYVVWVGEQQFQLTGRQFELLVFLYDHLGKVRTRDQILNHLNPNEYHHNPSSVDSLVRYVRKKIEPIPGHPRYLLTAPGKGYRLVEIPETDR